MARIRIQNPAPRELCQELLSLADNGEPSGSWARHSGTIDGVLGEMGGRIGEMSRNIYLLEADIGRDSPFLYGFAVVETMPNEEGELHARRIRMTINDPTLPSGELPDHRISDYQDEGRQPFADCFQMSNNVNRPLSELLIGERMPNPLMQDVLRQRMQEQNAQQ